MGFGGLLEMPEMPLRRNMILEIVKVFEPSNQTFRLCGDDVQILPDNVKEIMGLQIEGNSVFELRGEKVTKTAGNTIDKDLFLRFAGEDKNMQINRLRDIIIKSGIPDDDFRRAFALFTIGVILARTTKPYVHSSYFPLVREISDIPKFNWGEFTLNFLLYSLYQYKVVRNTSLLANLTFLRVSSICCSQHL
jgi:hypothetical protein